MIYACHRRLRLYWDCWYCRKMKKEWLSWSKEELLIKGCMYWTEFSGSSESENADSVTITIDKRQVLNVETLNQILEKIAREEWP